MPQVDVSAGPIEYRDTGGAGPVVVLVGGLAIGPSLWDGVVARLQGEHRVIVPTLPWGAHRIPMRADAHLTMPGQAKVLAEFLAALELTDVTLVENDTGMAQLVAADHPARLARLVLVSCEAFDNYPPGLPGKMVALAAKVPGGVTLAAAQMRVRALRRSPLMLGRMSVKPLPHELTDEWLQPLFSNRDVRRDLRKYAGSLDRQVLTDAAERLRGFDRPALVVWGAQDRVMPVEHGRRLAELLPQGRFALVPGAGTLVPFDAPDRLADLLLEFIADTTAVPAHHDG